MTKRVAKLVFLVVAILAGVVLWQKTQLELLALSRIDPVPQAQALVDAGHYAEAADYMAFFMDYSYVSADPAAQRLAEEIAAVRGSTEYRAQKIGEGLLAGTSDESLGQIAGVVTDFFVIGDIRDLTWQALNWSRGEDVDEVVAALSAIGLAATGAQVLSAGTASPIKGGVALLKLAKKMGKLPAWLGRYVVNAAQSVKRTRDLKGVSGVFVDVSKLARHAGIKNGLHLLEQTKNAGSLKRMAAFSKVFGNNSAMVHRLGGAAALQASKRADTLGPKTIQRASTYGPDGVRALNKAGKARFIKYTSRAGKVAYKGDLTQVLTRFLAGLPNWALVLVMALGTLLALPRSVRRLLGRRRRPARQSIKEAEVAADATPAS